MSRSEWSWRLLDAEDRVVESEVTPVFTTRFDAEAWLGETWRTLAARHVATVELTEQGRSAGPPIPLHRP